jgi:chromate reductase, NAD(P)H dehydrogenase (quinone)
MKKIHVGIVVGSNRRESINRRLASGIMRLVDPKKYSFVLLDIAGLPMFNLDDERNSPHTVRDFKASVRQTDALLFVTPEHNRSVPAVLKNAVDWGSRPLAENIWNGKPVAITGSSPGPIGSAVAQLHLRQILGALGALIVGGEAYISVRPDLYDAAGSINSAIVREVIDQHLTRLYDTTSALLVQKTT